APPSRSGMWNAAPAWCRTTIPTRSSTRRIAIDTSWWQGANIGASRLSIERGQAMPFSTRYVFVVSMDVDPAKETLFNEVYDTEHVPFLKQVPGVREVTRMQGEPFTHQVSGEAIAKKHEAARYTAIYEIDSPDVLMRPEWRVQGEKGRW